MAGSSNGVIHRVRHLLRHVDPSPDDELLARFIDDRDGEAFALLVRRHGAMVHGVCRRVLRNGADADDAFQATFLVLARRAAAVRPRSLLGNWLYGVAYRTALEAKRAAAVRRVRERRAAEMKNRAPANNGAPPDLREVLDRELTALPDIYRAAIVLCDLEGLSRKDAARRLGWSEGTLSGRLFRARSMLADRLSRHGLAIPAAGVGILTGTATAAVPAALAESTVRIGVLVAAGEAAAIVAAPVAALTEGVMKAMLLTKLKGIATALVVGCAVLATSVAGWQANSVGAADGQAQGEAGRGASQRDPDKERIAQLERERDELLKMVRDLKDRLAKLEAAQGEKFQGDKVRRFAADDEKAALEDLLKLKRFQDDKGKVALEELAAKIKQLEAERAKAAGGQKPKIVVGGGPAADILEKLRKIEEELAKDPTLRGGAIPKDLIEKLKALELDAAKGARMKRVEEVEKNLKPKQPSGDRVAELEDRVKAMEADLKKLLVELERLRRK